MLPSSILYDRLRSPHERTAERRVHAPIMNGKRMFLVLHECTFVACREHHELFFDLCERADQSWGYGNDATFSSNRPFEPMIARERNAENADAFSHVGKCAAGDDRHGKAARACLQRTAHARVHPRFPRLRDYRRKRSIKIKEYDGSASFPYTPPYFRGVPKRILHQPRLVRAFINSADQRYTL